MPSTNNIFPESNPSRPDGLEKLIYKRENEERIVVWATGISGSGRLEYLKLQQELAQANERHFELLDASDFLWDAFGERNQHITKENILDVRTRELQDKLGSAYDKITQIIGDHPDTDFVVSGHATFHWNSDVKLGYHPSFFKERFKPDLFVNIVDNETDISKTLQSSPYAAQWAGQNLNEEKIVQWLSNEFTNTKLWADHSGSPWCVIPRYMSPTTLYMAMHHPETPWIYYAQQMTHQTFDGETYPAADEFFKELVTRGVVFNPKGYEIYRFDEDNLFTSHFTDVRDTEWFVPSSTMVIAFYHRPAPSEGMADETFEAFNLGKWVYRVWPPNEKGETYFSPFVYSNSHQIFDDVKSLLEHFDKTHGGPKDLIIPEHIMDHAFSVSQRNVVKPTNYQQI